MTNTMRLIGVGEVEGTPASELKVGDITRWNYGGIERITSIEFSKTGKTIIVEIEYMDYDNQVVTSKRQFRATRLVNIIGRGNTRLTGKYNFRSEEEENLVAKYMSNPVFKYDEVEEEEAPVLVETVEVVEEVQEETVEIKKAHFESKPSNIKEVKMREISSYDSYAVAETIELNIVEFYDLCDSLLSSREYLEGKGGTYSTTEPEGCEDVDNFFDLTPAQQKEWRKGAYRNCVKVTCSSATFDVLIDPQGYNYGRYVAIEYK
ncbi:hypothetical protein CON09_08305 [Bacillus anthracis]|nr:hypothetical protein CON09_08305 [Bacillus anthracis]